MFLDRCFLRKTLDYTFLKLNPRNVFYKDDLQKKSLKIYRGKIEIDAHDKTPGTLEIDKHRFKIFTEDGFYLPEEVQLEGKKRMSVKDFLNGFQHFDHISMA